MDIRTHVAVTSMHAILPTFASSFVRNAASIHMSWGMMFGTVRAIAGTPGSAHAKSIRNSRFANSRHQPGLAGRLKAKESLDELHHVGGRPGRRMGAHHLVPDGYRGYKTGTVHDGVLTGPIF